MDKGLEFRQCMFVSLLNLITDFWILWRFVCESRRLFLNLAGIPRSEKTNQRNVGMRGKKGRSYVNSKVMSQELSLRIFKRKIDFKKAHTHKKPSSSFIFRSSGCSLSNPHQISKLTRGLPQTSLAVFL